ncbi:MAG TPA: TIGR02452 family protein [Polyangiaceae bacterium]|nr:TIGR02452 family protein [Polyangiaceae bacterium]
MNRSDRLRVAHETLEIVKRGEYLTRRGDLVSIREAVRECERGTEVLLPDALEGLSRTLLSNVRNGSPAQLTVVHETTLQGIARLHAESPRGIAVLNFASARNPGGGFLNGSQAQEESLARSSALYSSLQCAPAFYEHHRQLSSLLYTDRMVLSPDCPVFRDDRGELLPSPQLVTFITSPAPNAGAIAENRPEELALLDETLRRRSEYILALAASRGLSRLVLGAWGCGVFRNDPARVASAFVTHLRGAWAYHFRQVTFSVFDASPARDTLRAFELALSTSSRP